MVLTDAQIEAVRKYVAADVELQRLLGSHHLHGERTRLLLDDSRLVTLTKVENRMIVAVDPIQVVK